MAVAVVQSIAHAGNPPATFGAGVTAGNTVFLVAAGYTTAAGTPTISAVKLGGTAVTGTIAFFNNGTTDGILSPLSGSNAAYIAIIMIPNVPGGGTAVTYTAAGFSGIIGQAIYEVSGLGPIPVLDQSSPGSSATGTAVTSGASGAITSATEIVFGGTMAFVGTPATNSGWTCLQPGGGADMCAGYQIPVSAGGTYTWAQTSSGSPWAAFVATVKPSPIPAPFYPATQARAKLPVPFLKGRAASSPGAPVQNPGVVPVYGAVPGAVRASLPVNPRGRISSASGMPPVHAGPAFVPFPQPVRARLPLQPLLRGRAASSAGAPVRNPPLPAGPPFFPLPWPARARIPQNAPRGRTAGSPGGPVQNPPPPPGPPFYPFRQAVHIRFTLPPRGRTAGGRGGPLRNPSPGPVFTQAPRPARAVIPQNAPRGRVASSPGAPVVNIHRILVAAGDPFTTWATGSLLTFQP